MIDPKEQQYQKEAAEKARRLYVDALSPHSSKVDWDREVAKAKTKVEAALSASENLSNVARAISLSGDNLEVFRFLLAPPKSQDQFVHISEAYRKSFEGNKVPHQLSISVANDIKNWMDSFYTSDRFDEAIRKTVLVEVVSRLMASQSFATSQRGNQSEQQELAVVNALISAGWSQRPTQGLIRRELRAFEFAHKFKMDTKSRPQEVDIACGLGEEYVVAIECKVTNDATNSIKRVNDIIKKCEGWEHWGSFVITATVLQGVLDYKDVSKLLHKEINVFWSHDTERLLAWLGTQIKEPAKAQKTSRVNLNAPKAYIDEPVELQTNEEF